MSTFTEQVWSVTGAVLAVLFLVAVLLAGIIGIACLVLRALEAITEDD